MRAFGLVWIVTWVGCEGLKDDVPDASTGEVDGGADHADAPDEGCGALAASGTDIYVDSASTNEVGTAACPLRTISLAIAFANASSAAQITIHVASGTYTAARGEVFPLTLRRAITVVGAGVETTTVLGGGHVTPGPYWGTDNATFVVGDATQSISLRGLKVLPGPIESGHETIGVFCDRGNVTQMNGAPPAPNTMLDGLEIGPGYGTDVKLLGTTPGCNLKMTSSTLHGGAQGWGTGLFVAGSGCGGWGDQSAPNPVAFEAGDETSGGGNHFLGIHSTVASVPGKAIAIEGCVARARVSSSLFEDSDVGIWSTVVGGPGAARLEVLRNTFQNLGTGVFLEMPNAMIPTFDDNVFTQIRRGSGAPGTALDVSATSFGPRQPTFDNASGFPALLRGRRNRFVGNDVGVLLETGDPNVVAASSSIDFGTPSDAGGNDFRCNSSGSASAPGGDLWIDAIGAAGITFSFQGNGWDHDSPTTGSGTPAADGTDVVFARTPHTNVDTGNPHKSAVACPAGANP